MKNRFYIMLMLLTFGIVLVPNVASACDAVAGQCCCKKQNNKKSDTKDCCQKSKHHSKNKKGCGGKCGDKSCHCSSSNLSLALPNVWDVSCVSFTFPTDKVKFYYTKTFHNSGFCALWLPPKIG